MTNYDIDYKKSNFVLYMYLYICVCGISLINYYVVKPRTLRVCVSHLPHCVRTVSTTIAAVSFIMCGQL